MYVCVCEVVKVAKTSVFLFLPEKPSIPLHFLLDQDEIWKTLSEQKIIKFARNFKFSNLYIYIYVSGGKSCKNITFFVFYQKSHPFHFIFFRIKMKFETHYQNKKLFGLSEILSFQVYIYVCVWGKGKVAKTLLFLFFLREKLSIPLHYLLDQDEIWNTLS